MIKIYNLFYDYLMNYISKITEEYNEFFIAITNIEESLLEQIDIKLFENYMVCVVSKDIYSQAVRYRNDSKIKKMVILSGDSLKQIDSLKDFIEYSIIPKNGDDFWNIIQVIFNIIIKPDEIKFVNVLLNKVPISLLEWLIYFDSCIINQQLDKNKMTINLDMFNLWKSSSGNIKLANLNNIIRFSDPFIIEKRLTKAITEKQFNDKKQSQITKYLSKGDIQGIIKTIEFEEVAHLLKGSSRIKATDKKIEDLDDTNLYKYSYEMALKDEIQNIEKLEKDILDDNEMKASFQDFQDEINKFSITDIEKNKYINEIDNIIEMIIYLPLPPVKKEMLNNDLKRLKELFIEVLHKNDTYPPTLLFYYCENQKEFVEKYFKILASFINDVAMSSVCSSTDFIEALQNIFCYQEKGEVVMPYIHPMIGFYFLSLRKLFHDVLNNRKHNDLPLVGDILTTIIDKEKVKFPIRFIYWRKQLFQLDYQYLYNLDYLIFKNINKSTSNSLINFKLLNDSIDNYISRSPNIWEINISIVDLEDITGIFSLHRKLQMLVKNDSIAVSRIVFNIISKKEEALKEQLLNLNDVCMDEPEISFKFTHNRYLKDDEYVLDDIIKDSDIVFLADTNIIYNKEKLVRYMHEPNIIKNDLAVFQIDKQIETFCYKKNESLELLWDTLHNISINGENTLAIWNNQVFNTQVLISIMKRVNENNLFCAVILSSNKDLLRYMYLENDYEIRKNKSTGKDILILNFTKHSKRKKLSTDRNATLKFSLTSFLKDFLGEDDLKNILYEGDEKKEICVELEYNKDKFLITCVIYGKCEGELEDNNKDRQEYYITITKEVLNLAFNTNEELAIRFREVLCNLLYEKATNFRTALMVYYIGHRGMNIDSIEYKEKNFDLEIQNNIDDYTNIIGFQEIMRFFESMKTIDESLVTKFTNFYDTKMLLEIINSNENSFFIQNDIFYNMKKMYERIKD